MLFPYLNFIINSLVLFLCISTCILISMYILFFLSYSTSYTTFRCADQVIGLHSVVTLLADIVFIFKNILVY